jgi:type 1 glutamine amidotransferase
VGRASRALAFFLALAASCEDAGPGSTDAAPPADSGARDATPGETDGDAADAGGPAPPLPRRLLVFSRTAGFRHASIPDAVGAVERMGAARGWEMVATEDPAAFDDASLASFGAVLFLMTSGDVLDAAQQAALEAFARRGGGFVGVHSASDTEYDWPFYGTLVGAWFDRHPAVQPATVVVEDPGDMSTTHLSASWMRTDEWYDFRESPRGHAHVLLTVDESSYSGGGMGADHPIAWRHDLFGGRAFYTAMGHTSESWSEGAFLAHVEGGIAWVLEGGLEVVLEELDGAHEPGTWERMEPRAADFDFTVTRDALAMTDQTGLNQHLVRSGIALSPGRPYAIEIDFTIHAPLEGLESFAVNFLQGGAEGDLSPIDCFTANVDLDRGPGSVGGTMKHMGFVDGAYRDVGQRLVAWGEADHTYRMKIEVHRTLRGDRADGTATVTVLEGAAVRERYEQSWAAFPWQPTPGEPVRLGLNTHGADFTANDLRVAYLR